MAYVLMNTEIGTEKDVLKTIRSIDGVQEAFYLWGVYDIIARVRTDTMDKLTNIINNQLQMNNVHSKLTVIVMEAEEPALLVPAQ